MRKLKAYLCPNLTTFCRELFERKEEKRRRIRASDSFQFSAWYKLTAILRRNIHLTYPRIMSTAKEIRRKLLRPSTKTKRMSFFLNPVALQRTVWWFLYNTSVFEQENISPAIRYCLPPLQFLQAQT